MKNELDYAATRIAEKYLNPWGFVTIEPRGGDQGNGLLQTGLWYCIKANHGALTQVDVDTIEAITRQCLHKDYAILWRSALKQNADDNQNWDDYFGWLAACYFAGTTFPAAFLGFCLANNWSVDVQNPTRFDFRYWFARQPGFKAFTKMCAKGAGFAVEPVTELEKWGLAASILWSAVELGGSDNCMRDYCRISVARRESRLCAVVSELWLWRVRKKYGITGFAFAEYFQSKQHPLCLGDWKI